jgi:hypothetical protein
MTEGLFILTTIFVAYIVYAIIDEQKTTAKSKAPAAKPEAQAAAEKQAKPQVAVAKENAATNKPVAAKTVAPKVAATKAKPAAAKKATAAAAAAAPSAPSAGLKDPKTGEVATAYSNYRFTKRWIKDALVAEGLLEKVYTANELNAEIDAKIKEAIAKLEAMDKYKA